MTLASLLVEVATQDFHGERDSNGSGAKEAAQLVSRAVCVQSRCPGPGGFIRTVSLQLPVLSCPARR